MESRYNVRRNAKLLVGMNCSPRGIDLLPGTWAIQNENIHHARGGSSEACAGHPFDVVAGIGLLADVRARLAG